MGWREGGDFLTKPCVYNTAYYFFDDVNLDRREDNIPFIGFTSDFDSIKES